MFQYGVKYWVCNALVLCVALIVSEADQPEHLASWHPLFLVATVNVVFSEKVIIFCWHQLLVHFLWRCAAAITRWCSDNSYLVFITLPQLHSPAHTDCNVLFHHATAACHPDSSARTNMAITPGHLFSACMTCHFFISLFCSEDATKFSRLTPHVC